MDVSCHEGMGFNWVRSTSLEDPVFVVCAMSILLAVLTHFGALAELAPDPKSGHSAE